MKFLEEDGLQYLIDKIQNRVIQFHEYIDVTGDKVFLAKIRKTNSNPWVIKYKIISEIPQETNSTQIADVIIGGIADKLSYYYTSNIIYDSAHLSAINNTIAIGLLRDEPNFIGIDISNKSSKLHNIKIEIQYMYGCSVSFFNKPKILESYIGYEINDIEFQKDGIFFTNNESSDIFVKRDELSGVAFSGSYKDLLDKPDLLQVGADDESKELYFFLQ